MKVLIWTTGNEFTPNMLYKENYIIKAAMAHGDEVVVLASQLTYKDGKHSRTSVAEDVEGYTLKRFPYAHILNNIITDKFRKVIGLEDEIIRNAPDLIFVNCSQVFNVKNISQIKKALPNVKIVLDFSTKYLNSAQNWLSKNILHKCIYRAWIQKALPYVDRVFYISSESKDFAHEMYDIPYENMEHNNLPGETISRTTKAMYKEEIFNRHGFSKDNVLILYSGKIYPDKKVDQLVKAFLKVNNEKARLLIIGVYNDEESKQILEPLLQSDDRITFMNFVSGSELTKYVCAADMYVQPGSISQTCQTAVCCGTPLCFNNIPTHQEIYNGNGFFVDCEEDLFNALSTIVDNPVILKEMSEKSYQLADTELDYHVIYEKILKAVKLS